MAIQAVTDIGFRAGEELSQDEQGVYTATRTFEVWHDANEPLINVLTAPGIPRHFVDSYPGVPHCIVRDVSPARVGPSRIQTQVTVEYSSAPLEPPENEENPLLRRAKITVTSAAYTKPVIKDKDGDAIVNSAGDYFDPPPEVEDARWAITIQKNIPVNFPAWLLNYSRGINNAAVTIRGIVWPAGTLRIRQLDISDEQEENGYQFSVVTILLEHQAEGWDLEVLDQGFRCIDPGDATKRIHIEVENEEGEASKVTSPVLLDGSGGVLSNPGPTTAVFRTFEWYAEKDFSVLPGIT